MKNKNLTYILLVLALVVWGLIFYRIFSKMDSEDSIKFRKNSPLVINEEVSSDVFVIKNDYADPFGSSSFSSYNEGEASFHQGGQGAQNLKKKDIVMEPVVIWPSVIYQGLIVNAQTKMTRIILNINGAVYLTGVGEKAGIVDVVAAVNDSVQLKYSNSLRYFKKQK